MAARPILWHILKIYSKHGINDFIICGVSLVARVVYPLPES